MVYSEQEPFFSMKLFQPAVQLIWVLENMIRYKQDASIFTESKECLLNMFFFILYEVVSYVSLSEQQNLIHLFILA